MKHVLLVSVSYGHVLALKPATGDPVANNRGRSDQFQRWIFELSSESGDHALTLKSASSGRYLTATSDRPGSLPITSEMRQWWQWSTDDVVPPGAVTLAPKQWLGRFLNHQ